MHRTKRCKRTNPHPWASLSAVLRAERGESPTVVRRRRFSDRGLALTVYTYVLAFAAVVASVAYGLVAAA